MFNRYALSLAVLMLTGAAHAAERDVYSALNSIATSQDGTGIAQGIIAVGDTLTTMTVDETIAFRTSLRLLVNSGQVQKNGAEYNMAEVLWEATSTHLIRLCTIDKSPEVVGKVNIELGRPHRCHID